MKKSSFAFGKNVVLLGTETSGEGVWLEFPSWDCNWYWGFGFLESYTNNDNPSKSKDIISHSHFDGLEIYGEMEGWRNIESFVIQNTAELVEKFKIFYSLKSEAEAAHITNVEKWKSLNTIDIPQIMVEILKMLHPKPENVKFDIPVL